jgi:hypothetical protein
MASDDHDHRPCQFLADETPLAKTGRPMATLIHIGRWTYALDALAVHRPDVVRIAIEEFRRVNGLNPVRPGG